MVTIYWQKEEDDFCLDQLEAWRMCLQNVRWGDRIKVKKDFVWKLKQNEDFANRSDDAIIEHFDFLDKLTLGKIREEKIPKKYKKRMGFIKNEKTTSENCGAI